MIQLPSKGPTAEHRSLWGNITAPNSNNSLALRSLRKSRRPEKGKGRFTPMNSIPKGAEVYQIPSSCPNQKLAGWSLDTVDVLDMDEFLRQFWES